MPKHVLVLALQESNGRSGRERPLRVPTAKAGTMDFAAVYDFLFGSVAGVGVLIGASLVLCVLIAFILERRTRKIYADRGPRDENDEWSLFDDDEEGQE